MSWLSRPKNILNRKLYEIYDSRIILYPYNIEDDIKNKIKVNLIYNSFSNGTMNIMFHLNDKLDFKNAREIKKYFLDTIPHCVTVQFSRRSVFVKLSRNFGLDSLNVNV